jgi:hypothetical protein
MTVAALILAPQTQPLLFAFLLVAGLAVLEVALRATGAGGGGGAADAGLDVAPDPAAELAAAIGEGGEPAVGGDAGGPLGRTGFGRTPFPIWAAARLAAFASAEAAKAEKAIKTARETAQAERLRDIALIEARRQAQVEATRITAEAEAEKAAAADRAAARLEEARADAEALSIRAHAKKVDMLAEAEGRRAITEADNALSEEIVAMKIAIKKIETAPALAAELVKPAEKIDSIRIHHVGGLGGGRRRGGRERRGGRGAGDAGRRGDERHARDGGADARPAPARPADRPQLRGRPARGRDS